MVCTEPRNGSNVAEIAGPFVTVGGETEFLPKDTSVVGVTDGSEGVDND